MGSIEDAWIVSTNGGCTPGGVNVGQVTLVAIKHLKENLAQLHPPAVSLVEDTLREAWPCR
jgi:hypothetical protein